jgi:hypothetical protein
LDNGLFEVILVNNDTRTDVSSITAAYPGNKERLRVLREPAAGISVARNRGWREAKGEFIAFIDDDAEATPDWAQRILDNFIHVHPPPVAVGGKVLPVHTTEPPFWFSDELETFSLGDTAHFRSSPESRYGFIGANMAFTRGILEEFSGFSPAYGMVGSTIGMGEETELFTRIHECHPGRFWYDPGVRVCHCVSPRSLHLVIRCIRSYRSGRALAAIDATGPDRKTRLGKIFHLMLVIPAVPYRIVKWRRNIPTEIVLSLQDFCERIGYFFPIRK